MATNVTEKDKPLNEIMAWCDQLSTEIKRTEDATTDRTYGKLRGLYLVYEHCRSLLGYTGSMPSEVPNQSEGREMSCQYKVFPVFWTGSGINRCLSNMELFEEALNDGWKIVRMDTIPPLEAPSGALSATNVYILEKQSEDTEMNAAETDERTLPMADTHYAVSIRRIYDAHTDMLNGYKLILWEMQEVGAIAVAARDYPTGMLDPIPQQTLDDADALARIFNCKNCRNDETEMWE